MFTLADLLDDFNPLLPFFDIHMAVEHLFSPFLAENLDTINLTEDLKIVPCDDFSTEIKLIGKLMVEHRKNAIFELLHLFINLLLSWFRLETKPLGEEHSPDSLRYGSDTLIEISEELVQFD